MKKELKKKEYILEYDMVFANVLSFILLFIAMIVTILLVGLFKPQNNIFDIYIDSNTSINFAIFFVVMILWMVLHEIIHGIAYQVMGAKSENIVFGATIEKGVFYCKCKDYINKKCIMTSLLAPFILIGIITFILGFIFDSALLVGLSIINISGASGDLMMFNFFLKQDDDVEFKELGFSSPFVLRTSKDLTKYKYLGIKSIREVKDAAETKEGPEKKVTISKASWIFIIAMVLLLGLSIGLQILTSKKAEEYKWNIEDRKEEVSDLLRSYFEKNVSWNINEDNTIAEFPDVTFRLNHDDHTDDNIYAIQGKEEKRLIYGCPIISTYKYDLTGDGKSEIIANVGFGYGMSDSHIEVYDYANDKKYMLWDRGEYDYYLFYIDNEFLVLKENYGSDVTYIAKGTLKLVIDEEHPDGGYLTIENEEEL